MADGYSFYPKIIHPDDLPLLKNIHVAILNRLQEMEHSEEKWVRHKMKKLSGREKDVLQLAKQGKLHKEIADTLEISPNSVRNTLASLYLKFSLNGMMQAVVYATNHRLMFTAKKCATFQELGLPPVCKRTRTLISEEMLQRIKKRKEVGESINSIAKHEGISEGAIRYALKKP
jgi:DNA-binding CsgD family transcriptional regulator